MDLPPFIGLQKTSLVDYPEKIASVLFFPQCNLRCPYCHNSSLVLGDKEGLFERNQVISFLKNRAPLLGGVVLTGGEPLYYDDLKDFIRLLKEISISKIKLDTNGSFPKKLYSLIESEFCPDYIAMDIKTAPSLYSRIPGPAHLENKIKDSVKIIKESGIPYQFRTTVHPDFIDIGMVDEIAETIQGCDQYVLNGFQPGNCLNPDFNSHNSTESSFIQSLKDAFKKRGISCCAPSMEYSSHSF